MINVPFSSPCCDDTTTTAPVDRSYIPTTMGGVRWRMRGFYIGALAAGRMGGDDVHQSGNSTLTSRPLSPLACNAHALELDFSHKNVSDL